MLTGTNFKKWKEHVMIVLSCVDLDLVIRKEPHIALNDTNTTQQRVYFDRWECFNRMSLMIMKHAIVTLIHLASVLDQTSNTVVN